MSPHRILGPSFGQEPRAKRRGTGSLTGTSGRETCKEWGWRGVVKPRRERPETKGETNRAGRCKRETGTRNRERATGERQKPEREVGSGETRGGRLTSTW